MSDFNINKIEEKILKFWDDRDIFARSLKAREGKKRFVFFEGPPTANGKPGIHHFIGRVFKDLIPRYQTMRGRYVLRKGGWDTHGLPVEIEIEKELGLTSKKEIEKYGIAKFNARAKASVWKYKEEWQRFTKRIGFWLDLKDPYITYDPKYMESLWWIIKRFDERGLLYEGHKVLPWCPRCGTALSSHEVAQGYQDVTETSVYVKFKTSLGYLLAWTTTPWTLPGNVALAVGKKIDYVVTNERYILAKDRAEAVLGKGYQVVKELKGKDLVGLEYEPLFDIKPLRTDQAHRVVAADFVTTTDGTGIVHTAVMYGEGDYELGKKLGLPMHHTVAEDGTFTKDVFGLAGVYVKDAENRITQHLRDHHALLKTEPYTHSYPFCWRCKTPLIYYAKDSWFVAMSKLRKQLLKNNSKINWYPEHLKEGRFGEFLREVKDWAFSRERYWGTPLPVWRCTNCNSQKVIGSLRELDEHRFTPPTTFLLVRHGESTRNLPGGEKLIAYKLESDTVVLTENGKEQIEALAQTLSEQGSVDLICTSPFLRTRQSAEIIAKKLGVNMTVDERLREYNPETENQDQVRGRMTACLKNLERKHSGKNMLIVSHGDPIMVLGNDGLPGVGELRRYALPNFPYNKLGELDLHRPFIDEIVLRCEKCQGEMRRVKEVADVWFDSGAMPFAQWHHPFENEELLKQNYPADYISEGVDQTRGWFYTLLAIATALGEKAPYKNVISYSHVLDAKGKKMSKSVGNVVNPWDVIDQYGVDAARWYFYSVNNPGDPKLFALDDVAKVQRGFLTTLLNCLRFYELYEQPGANHHELKPKPSEPLDDWILSRLHRLISGVTQAMDAYDPTLAARALEYFVVEDLSKWWIRRSRDRFPGASEFLRYLLIKTSKLAAPFIPFMADHIYKQVSNRRESVHLEDWPRAEERYLKPELETSMQKIRDLVTLGLAQRKLARLPGGGAAGIRVRQPLVSLSVKEKIDSALERYLKDELNVKEVRFAPSQNAPLALDTTLTPELVVEGYAREISRAIQEMRKEAGYRVGDTVSVYWKSESNAVRDAIATLDGLEPKRGRKVYDVEREFDLGPGVKIWLGIKR